MTVRAVHTNFDHNQARQLRDRNQPAAGIVVAALPPIRRLYEVCGLILEALGKNRAFSGSGRNLHEDLHYTKVWLQAHQTRHLVVIDAQQLPVRPLNGLIRLADEAHVDLWLVTRPPTSDTFVRALARHRAQPLTLDDLPRPRAVTTASTRPTRTPYPAVPATDFHLFRARCRDALPRADFTRVDQRLRRGFATAHTALATRADVVAVAQLVRRTLDAAPDDNELITDIRAIQIACFHHDRHLRVDLPALLASEERPRHPLDDLPDTLHGYRQPWRPVAALLARHGLTVTDINTIPATAVDPNNGTITTPHGPITLPAKALPLLHALLLDRTPDTHPPPLIPKHPKAIARALRDIEHESGYPTVGRQLERRRPNARAWLRRLGITLKELPT
jgi:hypothetical protein